MENKTGKRDIDPVIDQKVIYNNKRWKGLGWWLLALLIILLAIWFGWNRHNTQQSTPTEVTTTNSETTDTKAPASELNATNNTATNNFDTTTTLGKLQSYFAGNTSTDSQWIDLSQVSFNVGSAEATITDQDSLDKVAKLLAEHNNSQIIIRGFADNTGPEDINKPLSGQRANAIKQWLIQQGVATEHVTIEGQGAAQPVANNDTAEGRDKNRRVAIQIKG